jgi:hypothetical protein
MTAPISPKAGRNIWAIAFVILAIAIVGTLWWGFTHNEASSAWLAIAFLLAIPAGIAFWRWQHYRKRRTTYANAMHAPTLMAEWTCRECRNVNKGSASNCVHCGAFRR